MKGVKNTFMYIFWGEKKNRVTPMAHKGENINFHSLLVVVKAIVIYLMPKVSEVINNL